MRSGTPPVLSRLENDCVLFDLRTVFPEDDGLVLEALRLVLTIP